MKTITIKTILYLTLMLAFFGLALTTGNIAHSKTIAALCIILCAVAPYHLASIKTELRDSSHKK